MKDCFRHSSTEGDIVTENISVTKGGKTKCVNTIVGLT